MSLIFFRPPITAQEANAEAVSEGRAPMGAQQRGIFYLSGTESGPPPFLLPNTPPPQNSYGWPMRDTPALLQAVYTGIWYKAAAPRYRGTYTLVEPANPKRSVPVSGAGRGVPQYQKVVRLRKPSRLPAFFTPRQNG